MSHLRELVFDEDKEELAFLNGQKNIVGRTFRIVTKLENHNFILMKNEEAVSQRDFLSNKEEEIHKDECELDVSQAKGELVLELRETELTIRTSQ